MPAGQASPPPADTGTSGSPVTNQQDCADCTATLIAFWVTALAGLVLLLVVLITLGQALKKSPAELAQVLSEPGDRGAMGSPPSDGGKLSASRIIAVIGLAALLPLTLGFGYAIMWRLFMGKDLSAVPGIAGFLTAAAAIFAPYLANQIGNILKK